LRSEIGNELTHIKVYWSFFRHQRKRPVFCGTPRVVHLGSMSIKWRPIIVQRKSPRRSSRIKHTHFPQGDPNWR